MKKKCKPKKELGGVVETMQSLSPLLSLIPGIGPIGSGIASAGLGLMSSLADKPSAYQPIGPNTSKYGYAMGGQLQPLSEGTMQVQANNPQQTDSVDIGSAMVDHGETITNNYVFSDVLKNPLTGKTFADENAIIAKKEKKIEEGPKDEYALNAAK